MRKIIIGTLLVFMVTVFLGKGLRAQEDVALRIEALEAELKQLKEALAAQKERDELQSKKIEEVARANTEHGLTLDKLDRRASLLERVKLGGYGSVRLEANDLDDNKTTFTYRRFVLTTDAHIHDRLRTYFELELERFSQIEYEKKTVSSEEKPLKIVEAIEGTPSSEIAVEQAWLGFKLTDWLNFEMGAVLVPIGRFNIYHDDNRWNIARRSLVDRGVPVIPVKAAWPELGAGFSGNFEVGETGAIDYKLYVVNGAIFDFEKEDELFSKSGKDFLQAEIETEFKPFKGTFDKDPKEAKAFTGRIQYSPTLGHEFAVSWYAGRYTPDFLEGETVRSIGFAGFNRLGPFELEYEYVYTSWGNTRDLVTSFARHAFFKEKETGEANKAELELKFKPVNLAQVKHGYWFELRYPFWPEALNKTFLGRGFENPQLIPIIRWEQVFFRHLVDSVDFSNGALTKFNTKNRTLNRITWGIAYSPTPLWRFQLAGEYTWANSDKTLDKLTNFLNPRADEDDALTLIYGLAFGF